ncbi:MAG: hypothetical protein H7339_05820 [Arcicella sp.]|nr:hypothetical protein [Arcicella sp.]
MLTLNWNWVVNITGISSTPSDSENIIKFIDNIFDLRTSLSQDPRFRDAYGDAYPTGARL